MKTFYTVDNNTGHKIEDVHIFLITNTYMCRPDILFLKSLKDSKKVYTNDSESFVVSGLRVCVGPGYGNLMPIIVDDTFTDVITGVKFECDKASSKFIKIDREIDILTVNEYFKSLEKVDNGIERYSETVKSLIECLDFYKKNYMELEEVRRRLAEATFEEKYSSALESIEQFKVRARKRLEGSKKN